jgi:hypothetical protein
MTCVFGSVGSLSWKSLHLKLQRTFKIVRTAYLCFAHLGKIIILPTQKGLSHSPRHFWCWEYYRSMYSPVQARGPGLVAQMFGSGPGSNDSNQTSHRAFRAFSGHSICPNKELFVVALILCSWHSRAPETNPTDLIFSGIFVAAPSHK